MSYYDNSQEYSSKGIDADLGSALEYNDIGVTLDDIAQVLATHEGQNDGGDWAWVIRTVDGRVGVIIGGCDYTGWDCQSSATFTYADTPEEAAMATVSNFQSEEVAGELLLQLVQGKHETWRQSKDKEFNV